MRLSEVVGHGMRLQRLLAVCEQDVRGGEHASLYSGDDLGDGAGKQPLVIER